MKKKLEMNLLNSEELNEVVGGHNNPCSATGHTIYEACVTPGFRDTIIKVCTTFESKCGEGGFSSGFYITDKGTFICVEGVKHTMTIVS